MNSVLTGNNIRELRHAAGLTLEQLANALGIKKNMLSNYELGKSVISAELLTKIADYFGESLDSLTNHHPKRLNENSQSATYLCRVYGKITTDNFDSAERGNQFLHSISLPEYLIGEGNFYGLKITDDSLNMKNVKRGAIAIVKQQYAAPIGSLVVYLSKNSEARYGIYSCTDENIIISPCSFNPEHQPKIFKIDDPDFKIIGKITWMFGRIE